MKRAAATLLAGLLGACGYTTGTGLSERGIESVAFQVVGNESYRQRFEVEISRYLARELPVTTDLRLATRADADAVLQVVLSVLGFFLGGWALLQAALVVLPQVRIPDTTSTL